MEPLDLRTDETYGLCKKDTDWKVHSQDEVIQRICKVRVGETCGESCWRLAKINSSKNHNLSGITTFKEKIFGSELCDVSIIFSDKQITSLVYPLDRTRENDDIRLIKFGFTKREVQIVQLRREGHKNIEIESRLGITHATVKTHVAHILRKVKIGLKKPDQYL